VSATSSLESHTRSRRPGRAHRERRRRARHLPRARVGGVGARADRHPSADASLVRRSSRRDRRTQALPGVVSCTSGGLRAQRGAQDATCAQSRLAAPGRHVLVHGDDQYECLASRRGVRVRRRPARVRADRALAADAVSGGRIHDLQHRPAMWVSAPGVSQAGEPLRTATPSHATIVEADGAGSTLRPGRAGRRYVDDAQLLRPPGERSADSLHRSRRPNPAAGKWRGSALPSANAADQRVRALRMSGSTGPRDRRDPASAASPLPALTARAYPPLVLPDVVDARWVWPRVGSSPFRASLARSDFAGACTTAATA